METTSKPSARENATWALHNLVAHPVSELCFWFGFLVPALRDFGNWLHDATIPADHVEGRG